MGNVGAQRISVYDVKIEQACMDSEETEKNIRDMLLEIKRINAEMYFVLAGAMQTNFFNASDQR